MPAQFGMFLTALLLLYFKMGAAIVNISRFKHIVTSFTIEFCDLDDSGDDLWSVFIMLYLCFLVRNRSERPS